MTARLPQSDESLVIVRPDERPWGCLVHALGWIPVWGFVFNSLLWLYFKNRSREMIFHIQQAIQFQIFILIPVLVWILCSLFTEIIGGLNATVGSFLQTVNTFLLIAVLTAAGAMALWGGVMVYLGKPFLYPMFGRRVLEGSIRKISEG